MFKDLFLLSKATFKRKAFSSFFLFVFESAVLAFFNCGLFLIDKFSSADYPRLLLAVIFVVSAVLFYCVFKAINVRFFFYEAFENGQNKAKKFFGLVALEFLLLILKLLLFALCLLPFCAMLCWLFVSYKNGFPLFALAVMASFGAALAFIGGFFYSRIRLSFFLAPYIYAESGECKAFSAIKKSVLKTEVKIRLFIKLKRKFFFLNILELFVLPAPFVLGYKKRTFALFAYGLI